MSKRSRIDPTILVLLENLDRAFNQSSWHGTTLLGALKRVRAVDAAKSVYGRKSIWQQAMHATYWKNRVLNKLIGTQRFPRKGSNWPEVSRDASEANWKEDLAMLQGIHAQLRIAVSELSVAKLDPKLRKMILGVAAHDLYHAGQVCLLKKLLKSQASSPSCDTLSKIKR